ncbi:BON domain-containing protein [Pseudomonadota bacterium]
MKNIFLILILSIFLSGCVETVIVGTVATGVMIASEKSFVDTTGDAFIHSKIHKQFKEQRLEQKLADVDVKVYEGRVILLGKVERKKYSKQAIEVAWKVEGVREVIDETKVYVDRGESGVLKAGRATKDAFITSQVKSRFIAKKSVKSINVEVETVDGIVYLIGVAQDRNEIEESARIASKVRGVKRVVSHVVLKTDSRRGKS